MAASKPAEFGTLVLVDSHPSPIHPRLRESVWRWTPAAALRRRLPKDFSIDISTYESGKSRRVSHWRDSLDKWALAGDAILRHQGLLDQETGACYDNMRLISRIGSHIQEHFRPRKFSEQEFSSKLHNHRILPEPFGPGRGWSVNRILNEGGKAAASDGIATPNLQQRIMYGIDAEAQLCPLQLRQFSVKSRKRLIRLLSFDVPHGKSAIDEPIKAIVYRRILAALRPKLALGTDEFNKWFHRDFDNVIHAISKKKKDGGMLDRGLVRAAIIELVFESWFYLAHTVEVFAESFSRLVDPALNKKDLAVFNLLYRRSAQLAHLPLVMLTNVQVAKPAVMRLLDKPSDRKVWGQLLRSLQTYAEILSNCRQFDREKKRSQGRGSVAIDALSQSGFALPSLATAGTLDWLAESLDLKCDCGSRTQSFDCHVEEYDETTKVSSFAFRCTACDAVHTRPMTVEAVSKFIK